MAGDNLHVRKSPGWWTNLLRLASKELMKQGVQKGQIAQRLEQDFGLSRRSIYYYLPEEFKLPEPEELAKARATLHDKYPRAGAPRASEYRVCADIEAEQTLCRYLFW